MTNTIYKPIKCKSCGKETERFSPTQRFCFDCKKIHTKEWSKEYNRKYYQKTREKHDEVSRKWSKQHPEYQRNYYLRNREKDLADSRKYQKLHLNKFRVYHKRHHHKLRKEVIELLGGKCVNPFNQHKESYTDVRTLQIDHINRIGKEHFEERGTLGILKDVINDPDRNQKYQLLCANCNWLKRWYNNEVNFSRSSSYYKSLRKTILDLLGNKCVQCGETNIHCLQIDHVYGGGVKENKEIETTGIMKKIKDNPQREKNNYQLLCANCNWIKRRSRDENK